MIKKILLGISLLFSLTTFGQTKTVTEKEYAKKPYWIKMMDIEGVNYNEIVKAYTVYWKHHELPEEEGDRYIGKGNQAKEKLSKKELKELRESNAMRFQVKKFEHWKIKNEPFIKENGNIMTPEERIKFHNQNP
ncbi:MAG: hypothetical protein ABI402_08940 [Ferruginibacter sp.]